MVIDHRKHPLFHDPCDGTQVAIAPDMRKAVVFVLLALAAACSDHRVEQTGPSTMASPTPAPSQSRVVVSGTVSAAENGLPIPKVLVQIVEGVNA
jgi:hypothetical protein